MTGLGKKKERKGVTNLSKVKNVVNMEVNTRRNMNVVGRGTSDR